MMKVVACGAPISHGISSSCILTPLHCDIYNQNIIFFLFTWISNPIYNLLVYKFSAKNRQEFFIFFNVYYY